jgi:SAM-dependent methyltransferase
MNPAEFANIARSERDLWWFRGMNSIALRLIRRYTAGSRIHRVFEGGCGTGYFATTLQRRFGWQVTAIDLSLAGLQYARPYGLESAAQADLRRIPFADRVFDAVFCMDVLAHFEPGEEAEPLAELMRVLRPGGFVMLRVSALDILRSSHSQFVHERQRFTKRRLLRAAGRAGIKVDRCTYLNSLLLPVAFAKFRIWEPLTRQKPASGVVPVHPALNGLLRAPLAIEEACVAAGLNFPLGQSILLAGQKQ